MKPGSYDIPAIRFSVVAGKDIIKEADGKFIPYACELEFEQIDGLSFKQFLNLKPVIEDSDIIVYAYIKFSNTNKPGYQRKLISLIPIKNDGTLKDSNKDISLYVEEYLRYCLTDNYVRANFTVSDILGTFCSRYMGRTNEEIGSMVRKKERDEINKMGHYLW